MISTRRNIIRKSLAVLLAAMLPVKLSAFMKKEKPLIKTMSINPVEWADGTWSLETFGSGNKSFYLNRAAREVWDLIDGKRTEDDICIVMSEHYELPLNEIKPSVLHLLESMKNQRLLV